MKKTIIAAAALAVAAASPAALSQESWQDKLKRQLRNENVTRAIGSVAGALLGTQIGGGRGKIAAIAVGTLAGYWLGGKLSEHLNETDRVGIASTTERAIQTGSTSTWTNPDTGTSTRVMVSDVERRAGGGASGRLAPLAEIPPLELVNSWYTPTVNLNVRGGPSTEYEVLHTLKEGTRVPVIGRVVDEKWVLIAEDGRAAGFAYAPLMEFVESDGEAGSAIRDSLSSGSAPEYYQVATNSCRRVTQEVTLRDGTADSHTFDVCQQPDGSWVEA